MAKSGNGNGNGDRKDIKETSSWHCKCGAMGKCTKGDEKALLALHKAFGCIEEKRKK